MPKQESLYVHGMATTVFPLDISVIETSKYPEMFYYPQRTFRR